MNNYEFLIVNLFAFLFVCNFWGQNCVVSTSSSNSVTTTKDYVLKNVFSFVKISSGDNEVPVVVVSNSSEIRTDNNDNANNNDNDEDLTSGVYQKTFVDYFYEGVNSYLANDWESCIDHLERSLNLYKLYYDALSSCRIHCEFERKRHKPFSLDYDHMQFFEGIIMKTLCLERCRQKDLSTLPKWFIFDVEQKNLFKFRRPYEYLQLCYYKDGSVDKAINNAYTALVVNQDNEMLKKSINFYIDLIKFDSSQLEDLEAKDFHRVYLDSLRKYKNDEWSEAIDGFEKAIDLWMKEHDRCRAFCEGGFYQNFAPDFVSSVSNYYVYLMRCKQNCTTELSFLNGRFYNDLYPSMYNFLQFSYYKVGNIPKATRCVSSYLLFFPDAVDMKENIIFYQQLPDVTAKDFEPRKEALEFHERDISEMNLLQYVDEEFSKLMALDTTLGGREDDDFR